jgi:hypothetical protein
MEEILVSMESISSLITLAYFLAMKSKAEADMNIMIVMGGGPHRLIITELVMTTSVMYAEVPA